MGGFDDQLQGENMRTVILLCTAACLLLWFTGCATSGDPDAASKRFTPVQVALVPGVQAAPASWDVMGLRLNIIGGKNDNVGFLDLGLLNFTTGDESALQIGGILNRVDGSASGVQIAGILNSVGKSGAVDGIQIAAVNNAAGCDVSGAQIGVFNHSGSMQGLQLGLINFGQNLDGIQIGLININKRGRIPFLPLINFGF
jgi:hypothetical protein